ncbi:MAG: hypothetical protein V3R67_08790 [Thermodesulfobacteriota bacterium]
MRKILFIIAVIAVALYLLIVESIKLIFKGVARNPIKVLSPFWDEAQQRVLIFSSRFKK